MLTRVALTGGPTTTVGGVLSTGGAAWRVDGAVVVVLNTAELGLISASGRETTPLLPLADGEFAHRQPSLLPNGRTVLFHAWTGNADTTQVAVFDQEAGRRNLLTGTSPRFAASGRCGRSCSIRTVSRLRGPR